MIRFQYMLLFICIPILSLSQLSIKDSIIAAAVYNDTLGAVNEKTEQWISRQLSGKCLNDMLVKNIIDRNDMRDLALPLGVFKSADTLNFTKGMIDMWKMKAALINRKSNTADAAIFVIALKAIEENLVVKHKTTLLNYRDSLIDPAISEMKKLHGDIKKLYSADRSEFMDKIAENLSPNTILGFNIQELLPPTHMLENKQIRAMNPIFKTWYFDRLLREAGTDFIHYFPARYDQINSYGPFQITSMAVADIQANNRLTKGFKKYKSMADLKRIEDHIQLTVLFAYDNWERLAYYLNSDSTLTIFNNYFKDYSSDTEKERKLRLFISGITACMHHDPPATWKIIRQYLKETETLDNIHYECINNFGGKQLRKYYRSSVDAYLIMKVYDKLMVD